jgi:hypothetical protein
MDEKAESQPSPPAPPAYRPVPAGYRQGIITAITVLLGFSLAFFRFWGFEAPGAWGPGSIVAAATFIAAIVLQIYALLRSLRVADDDEKEYNKTVTWFISSAIVLLIGLLIAVIAFELGK